MRLSWVVVLVILVAAGLLVRATTVIPEKRVCFQNKSCVWVKVADTEAERIKGLSGTLWLLDRTGMLFVFERADRHGFWMKGMNYGLDLIWLESVGPPSPPVGGYGEAKVVDITENVPVAEAGEFLAIYQPLVPANRVLEVKAGWVERNGIEVGDAVLISNF